MARNGRWTENERIVAKTLSDGNLPAEFIAGILGRSVRAVQARLMRDDDLEVHATTPAARASIKRILNAFMKRTGRKNAKRLQTVYPDVYWLKYAWTETMARKHTRYIGQYLCVKRLEAIKRCQRMLEIHRQQPLNAEELAIVREARRIVIKSYKRVDGMMHFTKQAIDEVQPLVME